MRKIIVFTHFYKPHLGGVEKYAENFYKRLKDTKVLVVTSQFNKNLATKDQEIKILRIDSIEIIKDKYFIPTIKGIKQISKVLKENKNCEVHTHTRFYFTHFIATYLAKRYGLIHYHFEHGSSFVKDGSVVVRFIAYLFDIKVARYILRNAELVFPISEGVKTFLQKNYKKISYGPVLYNSFNFKSKSFKIKPKPPSLKLLFVGRLVKAKGVVELVQACELLKKEGVRITLTIIGDGSERNTLKEYVEKKGLKDIVTLKGALPYEETQKEFSIHDVLINPSYTEGLPTSVLEALGNSLLVVATDVGGTREIIPNEHLIPASDINPTAIFSRIVEINNDWDLYQDIFYKIFSNCKEKFSWRRNVKLYTDLITH